MGRLHAYRLQCEATPTLTTCASHDLPAVPPHNGISAAYRCQDLLCTPWSSPPPVPCPHRGRYRCRSAPHRTYGAMHSALPGPHDAVHSALPRPQILCLDPSRDPWEVPKWGDFRVPIWSPDPPGSWPQLSDGLMIPYASSLRAPGDGPQMGPFWVPIWSPNRVPIWSPDPSRGPQKGSEGVTHML